MKKTTILILTLVLITVVGGFVFPKTTGNAVAGNGKSPADSNAGTQKITLSMKNYNYYPNTIKVKVNQPVSITLDSSVGGCYRSFVISDFGVQKYSKSPGDTINFVPDKKGTYKFRCVMGMGTGTIVVE